MKLLKIYIDSFKGLSTEAWMLSIVMLINRSGSMVLPFLSVYMAEKLSFSIEQTGIVLSFYGVGAVFGSFIGGYLTDKLGEYRVQVTSLFLTGPIFLLIPFFSTVTELAIIIFIQSLVSEIFRPANSVAITKYAKPENLTRAFSLNRMAVNLGFSIGPALGGILSSISYNFLFITNFVALVLAGIFYVYFFRKRNKTINRGNVSRLKEEKTPTLKSPYLDGPFLAFCVFCTLFSICFFQFFSTLPLFYKEVAQLDKMEIGFLLGYSGFLIVMLEMLFVHLAEKRLTIAQTLFLGTVLCGASFAIIGFSFEVTALVLGMTILCFGEILVLPFLSTVTAIRSEGGNKGAYMGLNGITFSIAFIITPLIGTKIAYVLGFDILWMITAFLLFIAAIGLYYTTKLLVR